jgi:hypothetical protein
VKLFMKGLGHLDLHRGLKSHWLDVAPHSLEALEDEHCTWEGDFST